MILKGKQLDFNMFCRFSFLKSFSLNEDEESQYDGVLSRYNPAATVTVFFMDFSILVMSFFQVLIIFSRWLISLFT